MTRDEGHGFPIRTDHDSFVVSFFGLDGVRQHWVPGNRRRNRPAREKRRFPSEADARTFIEERHLAPASRVYRCSICDDWHLASPARA